jgi:hypothetical protein
MLAVPEGDTSVIMRNSKQYEVVTTITTLSRDMF